jgi:hypothetical protein
MSLFNLANSQPVDALNQKLLTPAEFAQQFPSLVPNDEGGMKYNTDIPSYESYFNSLPDSIKQTPAYTNQKAELATGTLFNDFATNGRTSALTPNLPQQVKESKAFLESIKDTNPDAYWGQILSLNLQKAGWDAGQGKTNPETNAKIQEALQNAQAAGVSQENINNLIKINYEGMAKSHADNIAQRKGQGATLQGIEKVLPAFAAMATAGFLAPAAGALEAGSAISQALPYTEAFDAFNLASQGLAPEAIAQNLAATGLDSFLAQDMASLAAQGLSPEQIANTLAASYSPSELAGTGIKSLNYGANAGSNLTAKDVIKYANQARQTLGLGNTLAKLVAGGTGAGATGGTSVGTQKALANALSSSATGPTNFAQINMNQNPFMQTQQPTSIQTPLKQHDFLADLAQAGKTQPGLADLLRNA